MKEFFSKLLKNKDIKQLIKFFLCTQVAWWLDLGIYTLLFQVLGLEAKLSKAISYSCGAVVSYILNRKFTFNNHNGVIITLPKFIITNLCALGSSELSMYIFGDVLGIHMWICYFISIVFSFSVNYSGNRFWVFREKKKQRDLTRKAEEEKDAYKD